MLCHSPASPERRGGGKGAGWYTRHPAAREKRAGGVLGIQPQYDLLFLTTTNN